MEFHQAIDVEENFWSEDSYRETLTEKMTETNSGGVDINPGGVTDQKVLNTVRDWAWKNLEDGVAKMLLGDIPPVDPNAASAWYKEHDLENINIDKVVSKVVSFRRTYKEGAIMEWNPSPRGTLPNITSMTVEYDGGPYVGWQRQENGHSVQGAIEAAVLSLTGETVLVRGAGRTDSGVHAMGTPQNCSRPFIASF